MAQKSLQQAVLAHASKQHETKTMTTITKYTPGPVFVCFLSKTSKLSWCVLLPMLLQIKPMQIRITV